MSRVSLKGGAVGSFGGTIAISTTPVRIFTSTEAANREIVNLSTVGTLVFLGGSSDVSTGTSTGVAATRGHALPALQSWNRSGFFPYTGELWAIAPTGLTSLVTKFSC